MSRPLPVPSFPKPINPPRRRTILRLLLLLLLVGCQAQEAPAGPPTAGPPTATRTISAQPSPRSSATPVSTTPPTVVPPTAAPTRETTVGESKYDQVSVFTIEEQENEGRSQLHVSYPVTDHPRINERLEEITDEFVAEYRQLAAETEQSYQDYLEESGQEAATFGTQYWQHFDVVVADQTLISFAIEQFRTTGGNTGSATVTVYYFDRRDGRELTIGDLFVSARYLERLSILSREALEARATESMATLEFDSDEAAASWLETMRASILAGTEPLAENFDALLLQDDGTFRLLFDRYQVGPGSDGVVEIALPASALADLMTPEAKRLLGLAAVTPVPPSTTATIPAPTMTPLPPDDATGAVQPEGVPDCSAVPCVALTFDDGPSLFTDRLLDLLAARHVPATFFVLGQSARVQPRTIARMAAEGHEIGSHSWNHPNLTTQSDAEIREQLRKTDAILTEITGAPARMLRPPYGAFNDHLVEMAGVPLILWSVDPLDWKDRDAEIVADRITAAPAGAIILAHDIHESTVDAIPQVIDAFIARGIRFVTVSTLVAPAPLAPGRIYRSRPPVD